MIAKATGTRFNLLDLHDPQDDKSMKRCLRAYTILPKYSGFSDKRNKYSGEIISILKKIDKQAKKMFGIDWRKKWMEMTGLKVESASVSEWLRGRTSIPLIALEKLKEMGFEREVDRIMNSVTHFSSSTRDIVKVPKFLTPDILYLTGFLLSDGYLQKTTRKNENNFYYAMHLFSGDQHFLKNKIMPLMKSIFGFTYMKFVYRHQAWTLSKKNKVLFRFFTRIMGIPYGKKSTESKIPNIVKSIDPEKAIPFLAGLIDGDIGKHSGSMGGTFRSEKFVDDMILYLGKIGVKATKGKTNILKSGHIQNEFYIPKNQVKVLKDIMVKCYLPKSSDRINTLFCRDTKAVEIAFSI